MKYYLFFFLALSLTSCAQTLNLRNAQSYFKSGVASTQESGMMLELLLAERGAMLNQEMLMIE